MLEIKDLSTQEKNCKIYQIHKDDLDVPDSFLFVYIHNDLTVHSGLFSSIALAEAKITELMAAELISAELLVGDLS